MQISSPRVKIKRLHNSALFPKKAYDGDAGFDIFNTGPDIYLQEKEWARIPLGFALELPRGWMALMQEKSGLANSKGLITIGNVIDSTYRGECHVILANLGFFTIYLPKGAKIAQLLIIPCYTGTRLEVVDELSKTERDTGGFGSTGG